MVYTTHLAGALSGASLRQLSHWRHTGVLSAERSTQTRVFYSFRDVVALRTFVYLRQDTSLQKIRIAIGTLHEIGQVEHLSSYRLVSTAKTIALVQGQQAVDLVRRPGNEILVDMVDVLKPFETETGWRVLNLRRPYPEITVDPAMRGGHPVVRSTRVPFELVAGLLEDEVAPEAISAFYPSVTAEGARDALRFSRYVAGVDAHDVA